MNLPLRPFADPKPPGANRARGTARRWLAVALTAAALTGAACGGTTVEAGPGRRRGAPIGDPRPPAPAPTPAPEPAPDAVPDPAPGGGGGAGTNVYAADGAGMLSPQVQGFPSLLYVPNGRGQSLQVIDPATRAVVGTYRTGGQPEHVVPSWDLRTLWLTNDRANTLTPIDPATGRPGQPIPVTDPYNLYFTPDGRFAIVVAERLRRLDFRDPQTMALIASVPVPCPGVNHLDFSADGSYLVASCEFDAALVKVDVANRTVLARVDLPPGSRPQDVKLAPDGSRFFVADLQAKGLFVVDGTTMTVQDAVVPTGAGAHAIYVSRDTKSFYVSNRSAGTVSVVDPVTATVTATWTIPRGASPDMGGVSADGALLWLTGRYSGEIYAIDTTTGALAARIPVPAGPHGMAVYPQPGQYSLGHTGVMR